MRKLYFFVLLMLSCCFATSCGYTTSSALSSDLKTIHVENFKNSIRFGTESRRNIYFPLLEVDARNAHY